MNGEPRATLTLWDYRRRVAELYAEVRGMDPAPGWEVWRAARDDLFRRHPQSPLTAERRATFPGLAYYTYDPALRVTGTVGEAPERQIALAHSGEGATRAAAFGTVRFRILDTDQALTIFRLDGYGGGVFLPFRDATNGTGTYGGGRYLLDTVKGADLGSSGDRIVLDFNFAYHPSCFHDSRWSCPLAPTDNIVSVAVVAGERLPG